MSCLTSAAAVRSHRSTFPKSQPNHPSRDLRRVLRPVVSIEVALLREFGGADGAGEAGLDAALVVLVSPQRREEGVGLAALATLVVPLADPRLSVGRTSGAHPGRVLGAVALVHPVPQQQSPRPVAAAAVVARVPPLD